jgi:hypothetical protein
MNKYRPSALLEFPPPPQMCTLLMSSGVAAITNRFDTCINGRPGAVQGKNKAALALHFGRQRIVLRRGEILVALTPKAQGRCG